MTNLIYFDYLNKFRGKDVYFVAVPDTNNTQF